MNTILNVLLVILVIVVIALAVLYFMGRKLEKRQVEQQNLLEAAAQTVTMLVIDKKKMKVGYEIPMTRYFYEYQAPEKVEDIVARIHVLEADISASLDKLFAEEK